jgi:multiple antibiotic resistance protein
MTLYTIAVTLILIIDPLGNIPILLSLLRQVPQKRRRFVIMRELVIALIVLTIFLFYGQYVLESMQISEQALTISGGIILFIIALRMIFPMTKEMDHAKDATAEPLIVPLAVPMFAGPSALVMVMFLAKQAPFPLSQLFLALLAAWFVSAVILTASDIFHRILGDRCLIAIERLMGMILTTLAVQMFLNGLIQALRG